MDIYKEKTVTGDFIKEFIIKNDFCEILNNRELKFLNLEFSQSNLSLTEKQDINNQLRYYGSTYYKDIINNILWKIRVHYEKIKKNIKITLNINDLNEIEKVFIVGLNEIDSNNKIILEYTSKINYKTLDASLDNLKYFLGKGDLWTAKKISDYYIKKDFSKLNDELLKFMAMTYSFSNNPFISEEIINYLVKNSNDNLIKASSLYVDSMLYLRKYPQFKSSVNQAASLLDNALGILSKNDTYDAHFHKIFNRNGYALTLFKDKKISEALNLEIKLYNQLKNLDFHNGKRDMHLSVILYNIYQCYRINGDHEYANRTLEELLEMDSNDYHYRYGYINYLLQNNNISEAKKHLKIIEEQNNINYLSHYNYLGYIAISEGNKSDASLFYQQAYNNNFINKNINQYTYNLLQYHENLNDLDLRTIDQGLVKEDYLYNECKKIIKSHE